MFVSTSISSGWLFVEFTELPIYESSNLKPFSAVELLHLLYRILPIIVLIFRILFLWQFFLTFKLSLAAKLWSEWLVYWFSPSFFWWWWTCFRKFTCAFVSDCFWRSLMFCCNCQSELLYVLELCQNNRFSSFQRINKYNHWLWLP